MDMKVTRETVFQDEKVNTNKALCIMVLSIWSWSLLQFTFVLTATKGRKTRITHVSSDGFAYLEH